MKKLMGIILAVALVIVLAIPALAADTKDATVDVLGSTGGGPPIIKCKWETPDNCDPEPCAEPHSQPGTQVCPVLCGDACVQFWAVVTDPEDVTNIRDVWMDIYHPTGPPLDGSFKSQLELIKWPKTNQTELDAIIAALQAGYDQDLVTFNVNPNPPPGTPPGSLYTLDEVIHELEQCNADLYEGQFPLSYHQPYGAYECRYYAYDNQNQRSADLCNFLDFMPVTACLFDFTAVQYGWIEVCHNKWVPGDLTFDDPVNSGNPTVRNCGNTWLQVCLAQDDMGFGKSGDLWNVEYDARLGADGTHLQYTPFKLKADVGDPVDADFACIVDPLKLCNTQKIDFSIHVEKGEGHHEGTMWVKCEFTPFTNG